MRLGDETNGYITVRDVERLLEEAHERGRRAALLSDVVNNLDNA